MKRLDKAEQLPLFDDSIDSNEHGQPILEYIGPTQARAILKEHGLDTSLEQAEAILVFLRRLIAITSPQIVKK